MCRAEATRVCRLCQQGEAGRDDSRQEGGLHCIPYMSRPECKLILDSYIMKEDEHNGAAFISR